MGNYNCYPLVNIQKTMEHHHVSWVNQLFLWPFSIAMLNYQRVKKKLKKEIKRKPEQTIPRKAC
jgi:hypothetical protein